MPESRTRTPDFFSLSASKNRRALLQKSAIPEGVFFNQLMALDDAALNKALASLKTIGAQDYESLRSDPDGMLFYMCSGAELLHALLIEADDTDTRTSGTSIPISRPPALHSNPEATFTLYLDFNGHKIRGTAWNSNPSFGSIEEWHCSAYSSDWDETTFNTTEQAAIVEIWGRVAEDFSPFDINVTTVEPASWNKTVGHALITPGYDKNGIACPHNGYGGIAYVNVFGSYWYAYDQPNSYSPVWIAEMSVADIADAISHEFGHNLGLAHDGTSRSAYYNGHEGDEISWAPIMGTGYGRNLTQWSRGSYYEANQKQDDLAIIEAKLNYRADDHGNTFASATRLSANDETLSGVIEQADDRDYFLLQSPGADITIDLSPYRAESETWGGNADLALAIYDANGALVAENNPRLEAGASWSGTLPAATYYLQVSTSGSGTPEARIPTGYEAYGSIGQYTLSLSIRKTAPFSELWAMEYFGSTDIDPDADSDGDGLSNADEYICGTDPIQADSNLGLSIAPTPPQASSRIITWISVPGRTYRILFTDDLAQPFTVISEDLDYPIDQFIDETLTTEGSAFYRLQVEQRPGP